MNPDLCLKLCGDNKATPGIDPILVDANGNIDYANARVLPGDLEAFQTALDYLQKHHQPNAGVER